MYYDSLYTAVMAAQPQMSIQQAMVIIQLYIFELRKVKINLPIKVSSQDDIEKFEKAITIASSYFIQKHEQELQQIGVI